MKVAILFVILNMTTINNPIKEAQHDRKEES